MPSVAQVDVLLSADPAEAPGQLAEPELVSADPGTVAPGPVSTPWFSMPTWVLPGIGVVLLVGTAAGLMRRYGMRVRIEREPDASALAVRVPRHRIAWLAMPVALIALAACGTAPAPQGSSNGATITLTLHTVSDLRSVVISPTRGTFTGCGGGSAYDQTHSAGKLLGFPNGYCEFYPITVTNQGIPAHVEVYGSDASAADGDGQWTLCNLGSQPAVACTGPRGKPGLNQYLLANFNQTQTYRAGLTANLSCDHVFNQVHRCWAGHRARQLEGIKVTGPSQATDTSTTWTMTVTWFAVPGNPSRG